MRYSINNSNYCDFNTISVNELTPRSYFIPYPDRASADAAAPRDKRYHSPKVICLNGEWDFRFYPIPSEVPAVLDTDTISWDRIDVPSCWQFRGYDRPFYVNDRYQFPYNPPTIPENDKAGKVFDWVAYDHGLGPRWKDPGEEYNFVGIYRTFFDLECGDARYVLSFLGVASCADVYVNGVHAGYTEGSHNTAEFDVTDLVRDGSNELVAVVRRWCNGTYLECQDMFRNNGIFRDVLLKREDRKDIRDIDFKAVWRGDHYDALISCDTFEAAEVRITLTGHGLERTVTLTTQPAVIEDLDVIEWNAENPVLYDLYYETESCCIKERVGFRHIEIKGDKYYFNGHLIKFHGVNHHDTSCINGYTMSPEEIERDMKLCREYNIDTVRTSHYPPDPYLLEVCDEIGLYVVDEADLETHGTYTMHVPGSYNLISDDTRWREHYLDRIRHLYQRDKIHTSIIMWSLGNEAGGTANTDAMYDYIKAHSDIPVHYESVVHARRKAYDVASQMYPPAEKLHEVGEKTHKIPEFCDRPYFLCEYAHAMGVGPGGMEDYWKEIYSYDSLIGGCVWEMIDHAVLHEDGSYTYGGDHGEWEHDGNFCVDGMFYPDRSPSTGARIAKFIYRPVRVRHLYGNNFEVFNTTAFTDGANFTLRLQWSDGEEETITPDVAPLTRTRIEIDARTHIRAAAASGTDCLLTIITENADGRELAREQITLYEARTDAPSDTGKLPAPTVIRGQDGALSFTLNGITIETGDPYTILFRAATDNDFVFFGLRDSMKNFAREKEEILSVDRQTDKVTVMSRIRCGINIFTCTDIYESSEQGIVVTSRLHCNAGRGNLPRFGKTFRLPGEYSDVRYYGRSGESYQDMKEQAEIAVTSCKVTDMTEPNIRPQESGNRCDTRWASVSNGEHEITFSAIDKPFELGIKPYSDRELMTMKHREDEIQTGTYVTISAFQQGIGTGICGPETAPQYKHSVRNDYELRFIISCAPAI